MTFIILFIALSISLITDMKSRKILNVVTLPTIFLGVLINTLTMGWEGFLFSIFGSLTGFGLLVIPYALGGMAAGDVKLLMAIGALQGTSFVFGSFVYILFVGGIIAFILLLMQRELFNSLKRIIFSARLKTLDTLNKNELHHSFPYGVPIFLGTVFYLGVNFL